MKINPGDAATLKRKGITPEKLGEQLKMLRDGFPFLKIEAAATIGHGIVQPSENVVLTCIEIWDQYIAAGGKIVKMVPASGAASRMFKDVFTFVEGKNEIPQTDFMKTFFSRIQDFAFFPRLNFVALSEHGYSVPSLIEQKRYKDVAEALIKIPGLNYGKLPKALLEFHKTMGGSRTPLEEHLAEAAAYAKDHNGTARVHFTVSEEHVPLVEMKIEESKKALEKACGVKFNISLSVQKPSTDTVAALPDGTPYRENDEFFFRPGGHGALIENLNDIDADVIFIKNIDNIVPDARRHITIRYKQLIGGMLVGVKQKIDGYCRELEAGVPTEDRMNEMLKFLREVLCVTHDNAENMTPANRAAYLMGKFNRPLRICGMVRNSGEPGGGPYLAYNPDGTVSPQILESTQLNMKDKEVKSMVAKASHFNPVDLVCSIRDYKGHKFNLPDYVDPATGFISSKSREGVEIKALELPGLWNGAMSDWNTIFVEVPAETFNPVKTVNDLLRPSHQP